MSKSALSLALFAFVFLVGSEAFAVNVKFCFKYAVNYDDASASAGDDFWNNNNDRPARGAYVQVLQNGVGHIGPVSESDGCTGNLSMTAGNPYAAIINSRAFVGTNEIRVYDDPTTPDGYSQNFNGTVPSSSGTITLTTGLHNAWNIAAAAGFAQSKRRGGLSNKTYTFYNTTCPSGSGSCASGGNIYMSGDGGNSKYIIIHEMGHDLLRKKNGDQGVSFSYSGTSDAPCDESSGEHSMTSEEYQSAAVSEGWAHFYAATVFNDDSQTDCGFFYYKNVDMDGINGWDASRIISCETGTDHLGDYCGGATDYSTEVDWLRFLWDATTDHGLTFNNLAGIWDAAEPHNWNSTTTGSSSNDPEARLTAAAAAAGFATEWNADYTVNGVHR